MTRSPHGSMSATAVGLAIALAAAQTGCVGARAWMAERSANRSGVAAIPPNADADAIIARLNQNTEQVHGWRSKKAHVHLTGIPVPLPADVQVGEDRCFRLIVRSMMGAEADIGSNPEHFWCWMRDDPEKNVYFASHSDAAIAQQNLPLPIPLDADWVLEALGVRSLELNAYELVPGQQGRSASLVRDVIGPHGEPLKKSIKVDMRRCVVVEHRLVNAAGDSLAIARFKDYTYDSTSRTTLPRRIELEWPETRVEMILTITGIEVNPTHVPEAVWQIPDLRGCRQVNLAEFAPPQIR